MAACHTAPEMMGGLLFLDCDIGLFMQSIREPSLMALGWDLFSLYPVDWLCFQLWSIAEQLKQLGCTDLWG